MPIRLKLGMVAMAFVVVNCGSPPDDHAKLAASEEHEKGLDCLTGFDGPGLRLSHPALVSGLKETLRDPKSFEHVETRVGAKDAEGNHLVIMQFRAENGFGGMNLGYASAEMRNGTCELVSPIEIVNG